MSSKTKMLKRVIVSTFLIVVILTLIILRVQNSKGILFHKLPWLIVIAIVVGAICGISRGLIHSADMRRLSHQPDRHNLDSFLEHWGTAAGIFILIISGFFIKAGYGRIFYLNLHFIGLIMTIYFGTYFLAHFFLSKKYQYMIPHFQDIIDGTVKKYLLRVPWRDTDKYLSSQKSAFLVFALVGIGIFATGAIKAAAYYFAVPIRLTQTASQAHDLLAELLVLFSLIHVLLAVSTGSHRRLLKSLFTGRL